MLKRSALYCGIGEWVRTERYLPCDPPIAQGQRTLPYTASIIEGSVTCQEVTC